MDIENKIILNKDDIHMNVVEKTALEAKQLLKQIKRKTKGNPNDLPRSVLSEELFNVKDYKLLALF